MAQRSSEPSDVTQKALFGIDGGWYQDYWYTNNHDTRPRILTRLARSIGKVITTASVWRPATLRQDAPALVHTQADRLVAGER